MTKAQVTIAKVIQDDCDRDTSYLDQGEDWAERKAQYESGNFSFVGVRAVALIRVPYGHDWIESRISSPGLWGIESDSSEEYLQEVFEEERRTLLEMLESLHDYEVLDS